MTDPNLVQPVELTEETLSQSLATLGIPALWRFSRGAGVSVAIFDSGIDEKHEDLAGAVLSSVNFTPDPDADVYGHGTHCAGVVGARENGRGIHGIAPLCDLHAVKVINDKGAAMYDWMIKGFEWCIENGVDVASVSIAGTRDDPRLHESIKKAVASGMVVVCAAGNDGYLYGADTTGFPARYPETIGVGAITEGMTRAQFSSSGEGVNIMAPGTNILSCLPNNRYGLARGTSTATPFVAGVVALVIAKLRTDGGTPYPRLIQQILYDNATELGSAGVDRFTGYGVIKPEVLFAAIRNRETFYV